MMLTVSMTVSHLYQNLENIKSVRSLKQASEGVNYCDKRAKSLCRRPLPPWFGGGDHPPQDLNPSIGDKRVLSLHLPCSE